MEPKRDWLDEVSRIEQKLHEHGVWLRPRCELCKRVCPTRRSAVEVSDDKYQCRSCYWKVTVFNPEQRTFYRVNGELVRHFRKLICKTQGQVGNDCDWSASYQSRIEGTESFLLSEEAARRLCDSLSIVLEKLTVSPGPPKGALVETDPRPEGPQ